MMSYRELHDTEMWLFSLSNLTICLLQSRVHNREECLTSIYGTLSKMSPLSTVNLNSFLQGIVDFTKHKPN